MKNLLFGTAIWACVSGLAAAQTTETAAPPPPVGEVCPSLAFRLQIFRQGAQVEPAQGRRKTRGLLDVEVGS